MLHASYNAFYADKFTCESFNGGVTVIDLGVGVNILPGFVLFAFSNLLLDFLQISRQGT